MRIALTIIIINFIFAANISAVELKTAAQNSAPKYIADSNGTINSGLCIDIMKAISAVDNTIQFVGADQKLPFKRMAKMLESGDLDIFFGFVRNDSREAKYRFIEVPLYTVNHVVAVRKTDNITLTGFDDIRRLGKEGRIITMFGSSTARFLDKQGGLDVMPYGKSVEHLIKLLVFKRGRFAYYHNLGLIYTIKNQQLTDKVNVLPTSFYDYQHWAACSKQTPDATVRKLESALSRLTNDGTLQRIFNEYAAITE